MVGGARGNRLSGFDGIFYMLALGMEIRFGNPVHAIGGRHCGREETGASTNQLRSRGRLNGPPEVVVTFRVLWILCSLSSSCLNVSTVCKDVFCARVEPQSVRPLQACVA